MFSEGADFIQIFLCRTAALSKRICLNEPLPFSPPQGFFEAAKIPPFFPGDLPRRPIRSQHGQRPLSKKPAKSSEDGQGGQRFLPTLPAMVRQCSGGRTTLPGCQSRSREFSGTGSASEIFVFPRWAEFSPTGKHVTFCQSGLAGAL
jgi:hypothetical protein